MEQAFALTHHTYNDAGSLIELATGDHLTVGKYHGDIIIAIAQGDDVWRLIIPPQAWPSVERAVRTVNAALEGSPSSFATVAL